MEEEGEVSSDGDAVDSNKYGQILHLKEVHFLSMFALIYVGIEVTMGGMMPDCFVTPSSSMLTMDCRLERNVHYREETR